MLRRTLTLVLVLFFFFSLLSFVSVDGGLSDQTEQDNIDIGDGPVFEGGYYNRFDPFRGSYDVGGICSVAVCPTPNTHHPTPPATR
jgi:hypothetical protein